MYRPKESSLLTSLQKSLHAFHLLQQPLQSSSTAHLLQHLKASIYHASPCEQHIASTFQQCQTWMNVFNICASIMEHHHCSVCINRQTVMQDAIHISSTGLHEAAGLLAWGGSIRDICWMFICMLWGFIAPRPLPICLLICCINPLPLPLGPMIIVLIRLYSSVQQPAHVTPDCSQPLLLQIPKSTGN